MANFGTLYMIPCPIVDFKNNSIPFETINLTFNLDHFIVERARTARRWLSSIAHPTPIDDMIIYELDKNDNSQDLSSILSKLSLGINIGVISEAGCPGIADPGHKAVQYAHKNGFKVAPLVGPNSIIMALMGSGFNGQNFAFLGYLPNKKPELNKKLKKLENQMMATGQTQLFMEAPYRNGFMLEQLCNCLSPNTLISVACDINAETETILTKSSKEWKSVDFSVYHKRPTIFSIGKF